MGGEGVRLAVMVDVNREVKKKKLTGGGGGGGSDQGLGWGRWG